MSEAEFDRRQTLAATSSGSPLIDAREVSGLIEPEPTLPRLAATPLPAPTTNARGRATRSKPVKLKRVQRMFALEEELDKKLWLYAIHVGKDRSDVVNDLLRPVVASMVLYDSRDRRSVRASDPGPGPISEAEQGGEAT